MIRALRLLSAVAGSDRELLERYALGRDEEAFAELVRRHGAGVWAACVRLAGRDAEDAFQAVFLILSRKAGTVTGSLPAWLHAVTRRVASTARRAGRRRAATEGASARPGVVLPADPGLREGLALLDEELARLPERYRAVLIVSCLEGRSRDEAAAQLGWTGGQVKGRLERAREMLRDRLARRGVELGGLLLAAGVAGPVPVSAHPPSAAAVTLTHGVIRAMLIKKLSLAVAALVACAGVAVVGGALAQPGGPVEANAPRRPQEKTAVPPERVSKDPAEVTARGEIESLRKRVEALEKLQPPPAPEHQKVVVSSPRVRDVVIDHQYVARVLAHRHINVSALAGGGVAEVLVREGQAVKKGDVLFKVAPALPQARLDAEKAEVQIARLELDNAKHLLNQNVVTAREVAISEAKLAKATAKAKLAEAELALTVVRAPFDGLLGRIQQQAGSVVKEGTPFTTLSDNSVMWVYFNVPESRYLEYTADRRRAKEGSPVELVLANGETYPQAGKLGAVEGQFERGTGSIPFRADFPNPDGLLRHGQAGTVLVREPLKDAVVIPQRATFEALGKRYVYVVGGDGVARRREVAVRGELEDLFVVKEGLGVNDRIVVDGVRQVRDGEKVGPEVRRPGAVTGDQKKPVAK